MKIADLSPAALEKLKARRYDRIIEKHEGPWDYEGVFRYEFPEFLEIEGYAVLLPLGRDHHRHLTILRCIASADAAVLTIFLKDTTYVSNPDDERFAAGFLAVCERVAGEAFFVASVYHEWFILEEWNRVSQS